MSDPKNFTAAEVHEFIAPKRSTAQRLEEVIGSATRKKMVAIEDKYTSLRSGIDGIQVETTASGQKTKYGREINEAKRLLVANSFKDEARERLGILVGLLGEVEGFRDASSNDQPAAKIAISAIREVVSSELYTLQNNPDLAEELNSNVVKKLEAFIGEERGVAALVFRTAEVIIGATFGPHAVELLFGEKGGPEKGGHGRE